MKTAAAIFSWLEGIVEIIVFFIILIIPGLQYAYYTGMGFLLLFLGIILIGAVLAILIWRQKAVENGKKVACGIVTLLLVSRLGGIFTLCIPENELKPARSVRRYPSQQTSSYYSQPQKSTSELIPGQKIMDEDVLNKYRILKAKTRKMRSLQEQFNQGSLTEENLNIKLKALDGNLSTENYVAVQGRNKKILAAQELYLKGNFSKRELEDRLKEISEEWNQSKYASYEEKSNKVIETAEEKRENSSIDENGKIEAILKYKKMLDEGIITEEEFAEQKKRLLK